MQKSMKGGYELKLLLTLNFLIIIIIEIPFLKL